MCEYGDKVDSNTSDYQYYTCYFMEDSADAGAGAVQFDSSTYNCDKEHTCYLVYYDDNGNEIARSETVKFVRNSDYVFSNVKVASMPQHLGDKLSITYNCNKTGFDVYTIIVRKSFGETFDITDYDKFMDYYCTRNYGRIDFATHNRFEVNSDEQERKYDIYFYAEKPTDIRVIKEPFRVLEDLTFDSMPGEFTLTEISGVPKTLPKAALYNQKFMLKLNFTGCNPYIETFPLGLTIHYYRDGGETGSGFGCPIEVTNLKNNIYELDLSDAYWDLSSVKHNYMDKDIYKFEIDVQIADQRRVLTYTIE